MDLTDQQRAVLSALIPKVPHRINGKGRPGAMTDRLTTASYGFYAPVPLGTICRGAIRLIQSPQSI